MLYFNVMLFSYTVAPVDPDAPKPFGSVICPSIGEQLIVSNMIFFSHRSCRLIYTISTIILDISFVDSIRFAT